MDFCFVNRPGSPLTQGEWDACFNKLGKGAAEALRLEFTTLDKDKFARWLVSWGGGIVTSGALFPPLPIPFRVDYPSDPSHIGLQLSFLEVSVTGDIQEVGKLVLRLEVPQPPAHPTYTPASLYLHTRKPQQTHPPSRPRPVSRKSPRLDAKEAS